MRRYKWMITTAALVGAGWWTRGADALVFVLPFAWDVLYHFNRDRRYRYRPFRATRAVCRLLFISKPKQMVLAVIPESQRASAHIPDWLRTAVIARDKTCTCRGCPRCSFPGVVITGRQRVKRPCTVTFDLQIDHVIPRSRGGATSLKNCAAMCGPCNRYKSNKLVVVA
jgi:HNH endonuclease